MLIEEARWLAREMSELEPDRVFPLLDVGSSTGHFRTVEQPWIDREIFAPARRAGRPVSHLDAKPAEGVDVVVDLADPRAVERLAGHGYMSVFCSNLLEHVTNPEQIAQALVGLVPPDGYLLISCPYQYPYHPDPIDTMFRPTPEQLAALFTGTGLYRQAVVKNGTYLHELLRTPVPSIKLFLRLLLPFYKPRAWRHALNDVRWRLPWLFRRFEATCVVLQRGSPAPILPSPRGGGY